MFANTQAVIPLRSSKTEDMYMPVGPGVWARLAKRWCLL